MDFYNVDTVENRFLSLIKSILTIHQNKVLSLNIMGICSVLYPKRNAKAKQVFVNFLLSKEGMVQLK